MLPVVRLTLISVTRLSGSISNAVHKMDRIGVIPEPAKLEHYEAVGITEVVLRVPARGRDEVMAVLDDYARYIL